MRVVRQDICLPAIDARRRGCDAIAAMAQSSAMDLLERETRFAYGTVPHELDGAVLNECSWALSGNEFLLRAEGEDYFHYRKGAGVTIERDPARDGSDIALWLSGSVYSAVASINGLLPIHASSVCHEGRVYAFTGPSGAGKSTLVTALAACGLPLFGDDTLVLDLSDPDRILCLPGHKRLKLTQEAIVLTGASAQEPVGQDIAKFYARPTAVYRGEPLPLAELIFLERGEEAGFARITGAERMMRFQDDHYTALHFAAARAFDREAHFEHLARVSRQIEMSRFVRAWDISRFEDGVECALRYIFGRRG